MRRWAIGLTLLSVSWLCGWELLTNPVWWLWLLFVLGGVLCLIHIPVRDLTWKESLFALGLLLPTVYWVPRPVGIIGWLFVLGIILTSLPIPRAWPGQLGKGCLCAALVLLVQALSLAVYVYLTARSHELPQVLAQSLYWLIRLFGVDVALDNGNLIVHTSRTVHHLGATWECLLDPATLCFCLGAFVLMVCLRKHHSDQKDFRQPRLHRIMTFFVLVLLWIPLRFSIQLAIFLQHDFRAQYHEIAANMGKSSEIEPDPELRKIYDLEFFLIRNLVESRATNAK